MRTMARATYAALRDAGATEDRAQSAAAETGEIHVNLEATTARLNVLIAIVLVGFGVVIAGIAQIALRLPSGNV